MADDLEDLTKDELQDRARSAGVAVSGSKNELIERLRSEKSSSRGSGTVEAAMRVATQALTSATGADIDRITGVERNEDGMWKVEVHTVESRRIPPSSDVIGVYEVIVDGDDLRSFSQTRRMRRDSVGSA